MMLSIIKSAHHQIIKLGCCCSSVVEHFLGKEEVGSSILLNSSPAKCQITIGSVESVSYF
jgi:hypothetical protein